jgi:hypothetical protein
MIAIAIPTSPRIPPMIPKTRLIISPLFSGGLMGAISFRWFELLYVLYEISIQMKIRIGKADYVNTWTSL